MWTVRWFASRTIRQADELARRLESLANAQKDILPAGAEASVRVAAHDLRGALKSQPLPEIKQRMEAATQIGNKFLKPYPNASARENVDVMLVALVVALSLRTFFLQPMAIPTGSMQPTLFGITSTDLRNTQVQIPGGLKRKLEAAFYGIQYYHITAKADGVLEAIEEQPTTVFPLVKRQRFRVGSETYTLWFPPDQMFGVGGHSRLTLGQSFKKGEDIIKARVVSGDRLFVNRMVYNFRKPQRGDIIIFGSANIPMLIPNTHYIKRLIATGNELVQIGNDRHAIIDGKRLDASTPSFEHVYSFNGPPREDVHSGHVNGKVGEENGRPGLGPLFADESIGFKVRPDHLFVLGDNTMNSFDSRFWGDFPHDKAVGTPGFVFWPLSPRFGWSVR